MLCNDAIWAVDKLFTPRRKPRTQSKQNLLKSAELLRVPYGEIELNGYSWGTGGRSILLVHGWEQCASSMNAFIDPLLENGYKVVAFDQPAHGDSQGTQTHLVDMAGAIRTFIDYIGVGSVQGIIGHSAGAASAAMMLAWNTDVTIEKLVLISVPCELTNAIKRFAILTSFPEDLVEDMCQCIELRLRKSIEEMSLPKVTHLLKMPTLVIHDRKDREIPFSDAQALSAKWLEAKFIATSGLGHRRILSEPAVIQQVINFLTEN
ncbi:alpha/beta fold hydrolase [Nostoc sp. C117]|uniref:alpha/beta fold hydrolase n=1 Tax=Nostoc sp. C117 TaxID=3349875 RepID=UPI00370D19FA